MFQQIKIGRAACTEGNSPLPHCTRHLSLIFGSVHPAKHKENTHQILACQQVKAQVNNMTIPRKEIKCK